jgi:hypothetical protein
MQQQTLEMPLVIGFLPAFHHIAYVLVFLISLALIWQGAADCWPA